MPERRARPVADPCPCGRAASYADCCGVFHAGVPRDGLRDDATVAPDAETLMRSRYTAYVRRDAAYLLATWHASTRPATLGFDDGPQPTWLGLDVRSHRTTGDDTAEVVFVARYRIGGGSVVRMQEHSRFVREDGRWFYLDAVDG